MNYQWYWKSGQSTFGPLSTEELQALVVKHRIGPDDQIRRSQTEEWISADDIYQMFKQRPLGSTADVAAQILSAFVRQGITPAPTNSHSPTCQSGLSIFREWIAKLIDYIGKWSPLLWRTASHRVSLITMSLAIVGFGAHWLTANDPQCVSAYDIISDNWDELQQLQLAGAPEKDWQAYREDSLRSINEINYVLTTQLKNPSVLRRLLRILFGEARSDVLQKELILAGDNLQALIVNSNRNQVYYSEAATLVAFQSHLFNANAYLTGESPNRIPPKNSFEIDELSGETRVISEEIDVFTRSMVFIDVFLGIGGISYWIWKYRKS